MPPLFSLQSVLDVRHSRVEALEIELSRLLSMRNEAEALKKLLSDLEEELFDKLTAAQSGDLDMFQISVLRANILQTDERIQRVEVEIARLSRSVEAKRKELVEARQEEETLQILKRKQLEVYQAEQAQIETRNQDDLYIATAFRQRQQQQ
jgi:flagellar export protein FliJ